MFAAAFLSAYVTLGRVRVHPTIGNNNKAHESVAYLTVTFVLVSCEALDGARDGNMHLSKEAETLHSPLLGDNSSTKRETLHARGSLPAAVFNSGSFMHIETIQLKRRYPLAL